MAAFEPRSTGKSMLRSIQLASQFNYGERSVKIVEEAWTDHQVETEWRNLSSANLEIGVVEDSGFVAPLQLLALKRPDIARSLVDLSVDGLTGSFHFSRQTQYPRHESFNAKVDHDSKVTVTLLRRSSVQCSRLLVHSKENSTSFINDFELAASLALRPNLPPSDEPCRPTSNDLKRLSGLSALDGWRLLLGPRLIADPRWIAAHHAAPFMAMMLRKYGERRVFATASARGSSRALSAGARQTFGVRSVASLTHDCSDALWLMLDKPGLHTATKPEFSEQPAAFSCGDAVEVLFAVGCSASEGHWASGAVEELGTCTASVCVEGVGVVKDTPLAAIRRPQVPGMDGEEKTGSKLLITNTVFKRLFSGIVLTVIGKDGGGDEDEVEGNGEGGETRVMENVASMIESSGKKSPPEPKKEEEVADEDEDDEDEEDDVPFEGGPLLGYAQTSAGDSAWKELGSVVVEVLQDTVAVTCLFSGVVLVETPVTPSISCIQRKRLVRWLSPGADNAGNSVDVIVVELWSSRHASELAHSVARALGQGVVALPFQKLPRGCDVVGEGAVSLVSPDVAKKAAQNQPKVSLLKRGNSNGNGGNRRTLLRQASSLVSLVATSTRAFEQALDRARARKAILMLARARGIYIDSSSLEESIGMRDARALVLTGSQTVSRESVAPQAVEALPFQDLHLEASHFAKGGSGLIYKGEYRGQAIIAKCRILASDVAKEEVSGRARNKSRLDTCTASPLFSRSQPGDDDLLNEISILSQLRHPHIIKVFGVSENAADEGLRLYLVQEFASKGDLKGFIKNPSYTPAVFARCVDQILDAVAYMHSRRCCHLDLKLENVFLTGEDCHCLVADFGTSTKGAAAVNVAHGTIPYMPPECFGPPQSQETGDDDAATASGFAWDCYSLAVLLYALWERVAPWKAHSVSRLYRAVKRGKRPAFSCGSELPAPPSELRALCLAMWTQEPSARPSVAQAAEVFKAQLLGPLLLAKEWGEPPPQPHKEQHGACTANSPFGLAGCFEENVRGSLAQEKIGPGGKKSVNFGTPSPNPTYATPPARVLLEPPPIPTSLPGLVQFQD